MTTNIAESINGVFKGACMLTITALVQLTFYMCVAYIGRHRAKTQSKRKKCEMYTSYVKNKIIIWEAKASGHSITIFHQENEVFDVSTNVHGFHMDKGNKKQIIKIKEGTYTCNKWQSFGLSCSYVLIVCVYARLNNWKFVDSYYRIENFAACYAPKFSPIPHEDYKPKPDFPILHPVPTMLREHERPRSSCIQNEMDWREPSVKVKCGACK